MKKKLLLILCLLMLLCIPASAAEPKVIDEAGLLTADEIAQLESHAQKLADEYEMDVVILTVDSLGSASAESYADDYFDDNGYGIGSDYSGILLLLSMEYRDWAMSTCGETIYAITDYGVQSIFSEIAPYLSEDRYYDAFSRYLDELDYYFAAYRSGKPIDGNAGSYDGPGSYYPGTQDEIVYYDRVLTAKDVIIRLIIALVIGAVVAGIVLYIMRSKMNTARCQSGAGEYAVDSSRDVYRHRDMFLYSRTSRVRRSENNGGGGGRGGGSSTHRSSSGRSHGGGHGKF